MVRCEVRPADRVRVVWRTVRAVPVQGIRIKVAGGKLATAGQPDLSDIVLWSDTAPGDTVFVCRSKQPVELRIWNCWRDQRGVMQAWVGNAGMRVVDSGNGSITVACNARDEVTFADLVFEVVCEER